MLRTIFSALTVLCFSADVAQAEELKGVIKTIDTDKLTFVEGKAEAKAFLLAKDVKVFRFTSKTERELDKDGLKAEPLPNLPKGGVLAVIVVVDGKVTEITIPVKKKK